MRGLLLPSLSVSRISPGIERILGYPADRWIGQAGWLELLPDRDRHAAVAACATAAQNGIDQVVEYRAKAAWGDWVHLRERLSAENDDAGRPRLVGMISVADPDAVAGSAPADRRPKLKVLVADGDVVRVQMVSALLLHEGIASDLALSSEVAVSMSVAERYDMIVMSQSIPGAGALRAAGEIRGWERAQGRPRVPIAIVSGKDGPTARDLAACGVDAHLPEPVCLGALRAAVATHARPPGGALA